MQVEKLRSIGQRTIMKRMALSEDDADAVAKAFRNMSFVLQAFEVSGSFLGFSRNEANYSKLDTALSTEAAVDKILKVLHS